MLYSKGGLFTDIEGDIKIVKKISAQIMHSPHTHSCYELYFCAKAVPQRSVICGTEYEYSYPSAIISKPYTLHSMSSSYGYSGDYKRYVFYFSSNIISELGINLFSNNLSPDKMGVLFKLTEKEADYLASVIDAVTDSPDKLSDVEMGLLSTLVINKLYDFCQGDRIIEVGDSDYYVQNALKYIALHFTEDLKTVDIAKKFAVSRSKLDRDFKSAVGTTARDFIENCRLNQAKNLLRTEKKIKIAEIAEKSGYFSLNYFFRVFKSKTGLSPLAYRKNFISDAET